MVFANFNDRGNGAKQCDGKSRIRLFLNLVQYGVVIVVLVMFFITNKIDFTSFLCSSSCSSSSSFLLVPTAVSLPPASRASILSSQAVEVSLSLSSWFFGRAERVSRASILSSQAVEDSLRLSLSLSAWFFRRAERPASILSSHEVEVSIWWWSRLISTYLKNNWVMMIFLTLFIFIPHFVGADVKSYIFLLPICFDCWSPNVPNEGGLCIRNAQCWEVNWTWKWFDDYYDYDREQMVLIIKTIHEKYDQRWK